MHFSGIFLLSSAVFVASPAIAQIAPVPADDSSFGLGQIIVTGVRPEGIAIGTTTLSAEAIQAFNRNSLDDAVNLMPGVNAGNTGGSRNERLIFVRGFNRFQVPLSIDGIRVYLPADNRLDFGRFLTSDIAEVQVAKGYVSVLDGPDGMGGVINLVTRRPTREFEADVRGTLTLGRQAEYAGYNVSGLLGTRHDRWYAQASYARNFQDHWDLAGGFRPTPTEDGGRRDLSRTADWRVNAKIGFTPNDTDEYALSYTRQEGEKLAPLSTVDPLASSGQRFWTWPAWNTDSVYFLSTTALGDSAIVKTRIFRNSFYNLLRSFDNRNENTQTLGRAFNSPYWDNAVGGSAQLDVRPIEKDMLSVAVHYRRDKHVEAQQGFPSGFTEPRQTDLEETFSLAAENRLEVSPKLTLTAGAGYDWRDLRVAQEYGAPLGRPSSTPAQLYSYPLRNSSMWSGQGRLDWKPDTGASIHASISSRGRFPTIFERFSQRFGTSIPNPGLRPERATNYEVGGSHIFGALRAEGAIFHSHVTDAIVSFPTIAYACTASTTPGPCAPQSLTQSRNLGRGNYSGAEISVEAKLGSTLSAGGNYTYTHRKLKDPSNAAFRPTDVPTHKAFLYADWAPISRVHILPSADIASDRWTVTDIAPIIYYRTGSYVNVGLRVNYDIMDNVVIGVGVRNLGDDNYRLVDGYPEQGRSFFISVRARY